MEFQKVMEKIFFPFPWKHREKKGDDHVNDE